MCTSVSATSVNDCTIVSQLTKKRAAPIETQCSLEVCNRESNNNCELSLFE